MKFTPIQIRHARQEFQDQMSKIPKKNKQKFINDLLKLVQYAQKDDYENFNLG